MAFNIEGQRFVKSSHELCYNTLLAKLLMKGLVRMAVVWGAVRFAVSKQALQDPSRPGRKGVELLLA